jgi:hypothetical protein
MRVYIVTSSAIPNGMASTKRIKCLARSISSANINVEVLIYMRTERFGVPPKNKEGRGIFDGIPFSYIGGTPLRASNAIWRRFHDYADKNALLKYLEKNLQPRDIVFMYDGNQWKFSCRLAKLSHKCSAFYVKDLCEYPYGEDLETEERRKNRMKVFKKEFPLIDALTPISTGLYEIAKQYTNQECKLLKVPILVDFDKYKLDDKSNEAEYPYIFHSGTLTEQKDGILGIFKAFGEVHKKKKQICGLFVPAK